MGEPVVFLRSHVCNLRCTWCDAFYTWNPKSTAFWTESYELTPQEVVKQLEEAWTCENPKKQKRAVLTGGEPLLQKTKIDQLMDLMPDWKFEIETNGTIMPTEKQLAQCQFNCSPKLENSGNVQAVRIKPEVLKAFNKADTQFKFVVMTEKDVEEVERDFIKPFDLDVNKIVLMPQGVTPQEVMTNARIVVEIAKRKGYKLMDRLQVDIYGAKRRV
jgi:7-carboxy-7-deazaguanine synthase